METLARKAIALLSLAGAYIALADGIAGVTKSAGLVINFNP